MDVNVGIFQLPTIIKGKPFSYFFSTFLSRPFTACQFNHSFFIF